jgi:ferredoxin, 2Fe-2S
MVYDAAVDRDLRSVKFTVGQDMPKIVFIEHNGTEHTVDGEVGRSVMQAATDHFVPGIIADCGGSCSCGTCHGFVDSRWIARIPEPGADERSMLEGLLDTDANSRLTCQITITPDLDGMVVRLPKSQLF